MLNIFAFVAPFSPWPPPNLCWNTCGYLSLPSSPIPTEKDPVDCLYHLNTFIFIIHPTHSPVVLEVTSVWTQGVCLEQAALWQCMCKWNMHVCAYPMIISVFSHFFVFCSLYTWILAVVEMEECITSEQILRSSNIKLWIFIVRVFSFLKIVFIVVYYYVVHLAARLACYDSASWIDGMSILNDQRFVFQLACVCNQAAYHMDGWLRLGEETGVHGENPQHSAL